MCFYCCHESRNLWSTRSEEHWGRSRRICPLGKAVSFYKLWYILLYAILTVPLLFGKVLRYYRYRTARNSHTAEHTRRKLHHHVIPKEFQIPIVVKCYRGVRAAVPPNLLQNSGLIKGDGHKQQSIVCRGDRRYTRQHEPLWLRFTRPSEHQLFPAFRKGILWPGSPTRRGVHESLSAFDASVLRALCNDSSRSAESWTKWAFTL